MGMFQDALFNSDRYQYTMSKVFIDKHKENDMATFDVFFRKAPDGNNWAVVSGISEVLKLIEELNGGYSDEKYEMFKLLFNDEKFAKTLAELKFTGCIYAMREGELVFPNEPIITVQAPLIQAQILETPILSIMNHQMAVATKASRVTRSAGKIPVSSFGSRRAHGPWSAIYGDKAAYIAGCASVSNIMTEHKFGIPSSGTMAHSFVESYGNDRSGELEAFRDFVKYNPGKANILLIDTYDVKNSGLPNAIQVFEENKLEEKHRKTGNPYGIRIDSGDLAYLSKYVRKQFLAHGLKHAQIMLTNGLDEYLIKDLLDQNAEVDGFGVGDAIATSKHNPCFGGVYKLSQINDLAVIKLSEDTIKIINPGFKQVYRIYENGEPKADVISLRNDNTADKIKKAEEFTIRDEYDKFKETTFKKDSYESKSLVVPVVVDGEIQGICDVKKAKEYYNDNLSAFSKEHTRLVNPHYYKVDISDELYDLKTTIIKKLKK